MSPVAAAPTSTEPCGAGQFWTFLDPPQKPPEQCLPSTHAEILYDVSQRGGCTPRAHSTGWRWSVATQTSRPHWQAGQTPLGSSGAGGATWAGCLSAVAPDGGWSSARHTPSVA